MTASKTREEFEAWHRAEFPNDPMERSELLGYIRHAVRSRFTGYRAARRATLEQLMLVCGELLERAGNEDQSGLVVAIAAIRALAAEDDKP
jgi:hypothetical protein